jgi:hypothetical protein
MHEETGNDKPLVLAGQEIKKGQWRAVKIPIGHMVTHQQVELIVHVRRGRKPGPRLLVTAAVHGDEINGVQVVRRLLKLSLKRLSGDLILIPVVNLPAFLGRSRYLPDRRDLNRLFPGSESGSMGARLARVLTDEILIHCTHGIDLHTGATNRPNLPQIRYSPDFPEAGRMAKAFGAPVMIESSVREGSFRDVFCQRGKPQIIFEGGEAGILEPASIQLAFKGVLSTMRYLGMLPRLRNSHEKALPVLCNSTWWERAPKGGLFLPGAHLGSVVSRGDLLGEVVDPFGKETTPVRASRSGVIIGRAKNAVIDEGDGLVHLGRTNHPHRVMDNLREAEESLDHRLDHPVFDDYLED